MFGTKKQKITSDQVLSLFDRLTGVFFLVMIVLFAKGGILGGLEALRARMRAKRS